MTSVITGVGAAVPAAVTTNDDLARLGVDDEWIRSRTGISRRHRLADNERVVDLAIAASRSAMSMADLAAQDIDFIVAATSTADRISPGLAPEIGHVLGATAPGVIDLNGACTGFLYGLDFATARIESGRSRHVLVVGADAMTRLANPDDRNTAVLFGDGAGAVIVSDGPSVGAREPAFSFGSAGEFIDALLVTRDTGQLEMHGGEIYAQAVEGMAGEIRSLMQQLELSIDDVDQLVCHQANARIINSVLRELEWPEERAVNCVEEFGNTSAASIPIALAHATDNGRLQGHQKIAMSAFGAGLTWGAGLIDWQMTSKREGQRALVTL